LATIESASVVFPDASGPYISATLPRGIPRPPSAMSSERAPVEMPATSARLSAPSFMMAPWPYCFSIWLIARSRACS